MGSRGISSEPGGGASASSAFLACANLPRTNHSPILADVNENLSNTSAISSLNFLVFWYRNCLVYLGRNQSQSGPNRISLVRRLLGCVHTVHLRPIQSPPTSDTHPTYAFIYRTILMKRPIAYLAMWSVHTFPIVFIFPRG